MAFARHLHIYACSLILATALALTACMPARAFAAQAEYSTSEINTVAQVLTDASLHAVEQHTVAFANDELDVLTWKISGLQSEAEAKVSAVRMASVSSEGALEGGWLAVQEVAFQSDWRDAVQSTNGVAVRVSSETKPENAANNSDGPTFPTGNAWAFDSVRDVLYVFFDQQSPNMVFEFDYMVEYAAMAFDDVGELYWDYVPARNDAVAKNISVTLQLPVPEGIADPAEKILAWGHGAPGTIDIGNDGTVDYTVPEVAKDQYAQAHVLFPVSWLVNLDKKSRMAYSGTRLDNAVAEEDSWTDSWSAQQVNHLAVQIATAALCVFALAVACVLCASVRKKAQYESTEVAELSMEPAVRGRLMRWNRKSESDFVSTVLEMFDKKMLNIEMSDSTADFETPNADPLSGVRIRLGKKAKSPSTTPVERETMRVLFDVFGEGYQAVSVSDISRFATDHPQRFAEAMESWQRALSDEVEKLGLFNAQSVRLRNWLAVAAVVFVAAGIWFRGDALQCAFLVVTGILLALLAATAKSLTPKGLQIASEEAERGQNPDSEFEESANLEWFAPRKGRAGAPAPCLADQFASMLSNDLTAAYKKAASKKK